MPARDVNYGRGDDEQQSHYPFKTLWMDAAGREGSPRPVIKTTTAAELLKTSMQDVREKLNVLIEVHYSSLNFKDGMALQGRPGVLRRYPIVPGIDLAGTVREVADPSTSVVKPGSKVMVTGYEIGEMHHGGYSQFQYVKEEWVVEIPDPLDPLRAMALGTAGLTAMLCAMELEGRVPFSQPVLVTGAGGGVGSLAVYLLSHMGFSVTASTGRKEQLEQYLRGLGATAVIGRLKEPDVKRAMEEETWGGAVDTVGGATLAQILRRTSYEGVVAACGVAGGSDVATTVYPFILRGIRFVGINTVHVPMERREQAWKRLAAIVPPHILDAITQVYSLGDLPELAPRILKGVVRGRIVIDVRNEHPTAAAAAAASALLAKATAVAGSCAPHAPARTEAEHLALLAETRTLGKVISATQAAELVMSDKSVVVSGFVGSIVPELLLDAIASRFEETGQPRGLRFTWTIAGGAPGRGLDVVGKEVLAKSVVCGWMGLQPQWQRLVREELIEAWNLPMGVVSHMIRDAAAGRAGPVTRVGLGTYVDARNGGGKMNERTRRCGEDMVELVSLGGSELLHYKAAKVDIALLKGTTADSKGNVSMEHEPMVCDELSMAMAAHNSGGLVIVQVERLAADGTLSPRSVHLPGALVDFVVEAPPQKHHQVMTVEKYDPSITGELRAPLSKAVPLPLNGPRPATQRRIINHRAMFEIVKPWSVVNLGFGSPDGVAAMVATHGWQHPPAAAGINLTTESGCMGGIPLGGMSFGAARNADSLMSTASMMDFYDGGGIDMTVLGMGQLDAEGNVNVSRFAGRMPGCGGFINISQAARKVVFVGTLTADGLACEVEDGRLRITHEGKIAKMVRHVEQVTFCAASVPPWQDVVYVTERCVMELVRVPEDALPSGSSSRLRLVEIAPGIDLQKDILDLMEFEPLLPEDGHLKLMDARIFNDDSSNNHQEDVRVWDWRR